MSHRQRIVQSSYQRNLSKTSRIVSQRNEPKVMGLPRLQKKSGLKMRRLLVGLVEVYQVRPSFMMPYQIGKTQEIEKGLFMYKSGTSFEAVVHNHGHNAMFWWRSFISLGRNSMVGTTVKSASQIPIHLLADEKHTQHYGKRVYLSTTVGAACILGSALSENASEGDLMLAYGEFAEEAWQSDSSYEPQTLNTDGWKATQNAWKTLYEKVQLHAALKIRDMSRRLKEKKALMKKVWECYGSITLGSFSQRIRRLKEWAKGAALPEKVKEKVLDLSEKASAFKVAYAHQGCHRTSNMLDRIMDWQDRMLYKMRYFHSKSLSSTGRLFVRAMGLVWNFHPFCKKTGRHSPFADLNGFVYHDNWLENLMIAASLGGRR